MRCVQWRPTSQPCTRQPPRAAHRSHRQCNVKRLLSTQTIVSRSADHAAADLAGEVMILNLQTGAYYGLRELGARIWELLHAPRSVGDVCSTVAAEYDVDPDRCARDTVAFLEKLVQH